MRRSTRRVPFGDDVIPVLGPEHLVVCKAVFDRPKDWLDIEQVLALEEHLDVGEVTTWLARLVGDADRRYRRFVAVADDVLGRDR